MIKDLDNYSFIMVHTENKDDVTIIHLKDVKQSYGYSFRKMGCIRFDDDEWRYTDANYDIYDKPVLNEEIFRVRCDSTWEEYYATICRSEKEDTTNAIGSIHNMIEAGRVRTISGTANYSLKFFEDLEVEDFKHIDKEDIISRLNDIIERLR